MSRSKKYKAKISRDKKRKEMPYMSILFIVIVVAIFGSAAYLVMSKNASLEPEDKDVRKKIDNEYSGRGVGTNTSLPP